MLPSTLSSVLPALALMVISAIPASESVQCRQGPSAASRFCALPVDLANFQGFYHCDSQVGVGKPHDKTELLSILQQYPRAKANGIGHSWWKEQFCSGDDSHAINIVMTELDSTVAAIQGTVPANASTVPPGYPIQVNEDIGTVTVQAGIPQRILLDFLANYQTPASPAGYVLPAFSWYVDQSIGGAVATGTHGSSLQYGSLSSQAVRIEVALANATLVNITKASNPHLWRAMQVSVGRLGVMTELELDIVPMKNYTRTVTSVAFWDWVRSVQQISSAYAAIVNGSSNASAADVLASLDMTQFFWFVPSGRMQRVAYNPSLGPPVADPHTTATAGRRLHQDQGFPYEAVLSQGVFAQAPTPTLPPFPALAQNPMEWTQLYYSFLASSFPNGTFTARQAILAENEFVNKQTSDQDPYDQYEVSVPLETVGDCLQMVGDAMYSRNLSGGFVIPPLIRIVGAEEAYLSNTHGGPRMFFNIEDHLSKTTGVDNTKFQAIVAIFRQQCGARLHWGKAGWPRWAPCFDGSAEYPTTWCHFGCAVQELDPDGKFSSISNVWSWHATRNDSDVPFQQCCSHDGFSQACTCAKRQICTA